MLVSVGVLLVIEITADKIPIVDSVNDWVSTIVRPGVGDIAFGTGSTSETSVVTDPTTFFSSNAWVPIASGALPDLVTHATKTVTGPAITRLAESRASRV